MHRNLYTEWCLFISFECVEKKSVLYDKSSSITRKTFSSSSFRIRFLVSPDMVECVTTRCNLKNIKCDSVFRSSKRHSFVSEWSKRRIYLHIFDGEIGGFRLRRVFYRLPVYNIHSKSCYDPEVISQKSSRSHWEVLCWEVNDERGLWKFHTTSIHL